MTSDSLETVPYIAIQVNTDDYYGRSNDQGVFSVVCKRGDTLNFSGVGFGSKKFIIPKDLKGAHYAMVQFMNQDTFYLPEVIFRQEIPQGREFDYAFRYWDFDDDMMVVAKRNTSNNQIEYQKHHLPMAGNEAQQKYNNYMYYRSSMTNQIPTINLLRIPEFLNAWKNGDLKRKQ